MFMGQRCETRLQSERQITENELVELPSTRMEVCYKADLVTHVCFPSIRYGDEEARYDMGEEIVYTFGYQLVISCKSVRRGTETD